MQVCEQTSGISECHEVYPIGRSEASMDQVEQQRVINQAALLKRATINVLLIPNIARHEADSTITISL